MHDRLEDLTDGKGDRKLGSNAGIGRTRYRTAMCFCDNLTGDRHSQTRSPDLNRIEKCWAWLKSRIRKLFNNSESLRDGMEVVLKQAVSS